MTSSSMSAFSRKVCCVYKYSCPLHTYNFKCRKDSSYENVFQIMAGIVSEGSICPVMLPNFWNSRLNKTYSIKFTLARQVRTNKANKPTWSNPFSSQLVLYFLSKYFFSRRWKKNNKPHHKIFQLGTTVQRFRNGFQLQQWYLSWTSSCLHITEH